ncbi:MAG: dicarboxylate/amino acid:cation symporter, partial [Lachnospiraceae bacterium]|nr:dicarboxylate/amino acid:cation symporter [Lachnospiraceae bacterium]
MKKITQSLPVRLLAGVIIGIAVGLISNESFMNIIVTVKHLLGQVITFCVPLIVIGFIAPSITRLGKSASRMLSVALVLAYTSSVGAALFSMVAGY